MFKEVRFSMIANTKQGKNKEIAVVSSQDAC